MQFLKQGKTRLRTFAAAIRVFITDEGTIAIGTVAQWAFRNIGCFVHTNRFVLAIAE